MAKWRDPTPEELAMLENGGGSSAPPSSKGWRDPTPEEQSMLEYGEDLPWLRKGSKPAKPAEEPAGPREYPKADVEGASKGLQTWKATEDAKPTRTEALARGGLQGGTFGFADEIGAAVRAPFSDKTYDQLRDSHRAADKAAADARPGEFLGGQVIGGLLVPGPKGAGLLAKSGRALVEGAVTAAGNSEADNAKDIGWDMLKGAGTSVATTGVLHGVGKLGSGAVKRVEARIAKDVLEGVPAGAQDKALAKLGGQAGMVAEMRAIKPLGEAARRGPAALAAEVGSQMDDVGGQLGAAYKQADKASPGVPLATVKGALERLKAEATEALDGPRADAIGREIASLEKMAAGREVVKAESVHNLVRRYGRGGFEGGSFSNPSDAKQLGRDMYSAVSGVLQDHVESTGAASKATVKKLNAQYSRLSAWDDLAEAGAKREARAKKPGLTDWAKGAVGAVGVYNAGKDIEEGKVPSLTTAIPLALATSRPLARGGDRIIAGVYGFLSKGGEPAEAVRKLVASGLSRTAAAKMVQAFGASKSADSPNTEK